MAGKRWAGVGRVAELLGAGILDEERSKREFRRKLEAAVLEKGLSDNSVEYVPGKGLTRVSPEENIRRQIESLRTYKSELSKTPGLEEYEPSLGRSGVSISPKRAQKEKEPTLTEAYRNDVSEIVSAVNRGEITEDEGRRVLTTKYPDKADEIDFSWDDWKEFIQQ